MVTVQFRDENNTIVYEKKMNFNIELKREVVKQMPTGITEEEIYKKCTKIINCDYKIIITK